MSSYIPYSLLQKYGLKAPVAADAQMAPGSTYAPIVAPDGSITGYTGTPPGQSIQPPPDNPQSPMQQGSGAPTPSMPPQIGGPPPGLPPNVSAAPMDDFRSPPGAYQPPPMPAADNQPPQQQQFDGNEWDPTQLLDPKYGRFFNKQRSSDALLAIGAGLLKGKSFNEGLGNAADNLREMDKTYEPPSPADIMRARIQAMGSKALYGWKPIGQGGYDSAGNYFTVQERGYDGQRRFIGPDGVASAVPPNGFKMRQDAGVMQNSKNQAKDQFNAQQDATTAQGNLSYYDTIINNGLDTDTGSAGASGNAIRSLAKTLGVDLGDVDLTKTTEVNKAMKMIEGNTSQTLFRGQGAVSDKERDIVSAAVPGLDMTPQARLNLTTMMKLKDMNRAALYNDYMDMPADQRPDWATYAAQTRKAQAASFDKDYESLLYREITDNPGYQKYYPKLMKMRGGSDDTPDQTKAQPIPSTNTTSTNVPWKVIN